MWIRRRSLIVCGSAILVGAAWFIRRTSHRTIEQPAPNPYCDQVSIRVMRTGQAMEERFALSKANGEYLEVTFRVAPAPPCGTDGQLAEPAAMWPAMWILTPLDDWPVESARRYFGCLHYKSDYEAAVRRLSPEMRMRHGRRLLLGFGGDVWVATKGFDGEPVPKEITSGEESRQRRWTFIGVPDNAKPGDKFVCELALLPFAHCASSLRDSFGELIFLWRGVMTVSDDEDQGRELASPIGTL